MERMEDTMEKLTEKELREVEGGISLWVGIGIGALAVFLAGLLDGAVHPKTCEGGKE